MGFKPFLAACHIFTICIVVCFCNVVANKVLSLSSPADRRIWRNRLNWKKQLLTTRLMWCFMVNSASTRTPRSRTTVTGLMTSSPTVRDRSVEASLRKLDRLPNHTSSVLCGLSCRRRDEHQSRTSSMHWLRYSCLSSANRWWRTRFRRSTSATSSV